MRAYLLNILLALDVLGSAILRGMPGETLSGRAGEAQRQGKLRGRFWAPIINWVMRNPNHCLQAITGDALRAQAALTDSKR